MKVFVEHLTQYFSIRGVSRKIKMHHALAHRASKYLIKQKLIVPNEQNFFSLNYKENHQELAYIEHLRSKEFLDKPRSKDFAMFVKEIIENFPKDYFVLLVFGSVVVNSKPRDIDVLLIIEKTGDIESAEKSLYNIARNYTLKLHTNVISFESVYEMLTARDQKNVMNEVLNKHLILYGAELFYRLIKKGRK